MVLFLHSVAITVILGRKRKGKEGKGRKLPPDRDCKCLCRLMVQLFKIQDMIPVLKIPICQIYTVSTAPAVVLHFFLSFSQGKIQHVLTDKLCVFPLETELALLPLRPLLNYYSVTLVKMC